MQNRPATNSILRPSHLRRPRDWACTKTGALHCLKCHAPERREYVRSAGSGNSTA